MCTGPRPDDSGESDRWPTFNFALRAAESPSNRLACHKFIATASDSKEGG